VWLAKQIRARAGVLLTGLTVVTVVGGVLAFQAEGRHRGDPMSAAEALYSTLGLFAFAGNRYGFPRTLPLVAVYFLAPYITASALLEAAFQMLSARNSILLTGMRGHTVVCGAGSLGVVLAQEHDRARTPTVLVNVDIPETIGGTSALVVVGDMKRQATLRSARAETAGRVYLTAGDDLVNLEVATRLARQFRNAPRHVGPAIFCHIADAALRDTLLGPDGPGRVNYFNSYRLAAKALVARMFAAGWLPALHVAGDGGEEHFLVARGGAFALSAHPPGDAPELVVVVGLGRFGRAVAEQLAELLPARTRLRVVDSGDAAVEATRQRLRLRPDVDVHRADVNDTRWRADLEEKGKRALVFLCTDQDRENLRVAMGIARSARTVVRMFDQPFGERFSPAGGDSFELDVAGFRGLFHDAFPMLAYQHEVDGPHGRRIPRIRTCLRLPPHAGGRDPQATPEARWYLTWLDSRGAAHLGGRSTADVQRVAELPAADGYALDRTRIPSGWWLVRSGVFDALRSGILADGSAPGAT
jgi:Trk K+ transport system NAD-binding subunit